MTFLVPYGLICIKDGGLEKQTSCFLNLIVPYLLHIVPIIIKAIIENADNKTSSNLGLLLVFLYIAITITKNTAGIIEQARSPIEPRAMNEQTKSIGVAIKDPPFTITAM
jgi:hypothetical protein